MYLEYRACGTSRNEEAKGTLTLSKIGNYSHSRTRRSCFMIRLGPLNIRTLSILKCVENTVRWTESKCQGVPNVTFIICSLNCCGYLLK